jgi:hypothetical protein
VSAGEGSLNEVPERERSEVGMGLLGRQASQDE